MTITRDEHGVLWLGGKPLDQCSRDELLQALRQIHDMADVDEEEAHAVHRLWAGELAGRYTKRKVH